MKITKLGHCCLLLTVKGLKIMTDPGAWTTLQNDATGVDLVLITHEHPDHLHVDSLKTVLQKNPKAKVITNSAVQKILKENGIASQLLEHGQTATVSDVLIEGFGEKHAVIYGEYGQVQNTGYFLDDRLFYPGDALFNPGKAVDILALPVCGPWVKISEAINYAKELKPRICFPVHDGMLKIYTGYHAVPLAVLPPLGIDFKILGINEQIEL